MFDGKAFGAEIVGVVKDYVSGAVGPLADRLAAIEKRLNELPSPKDGNDGKDAEPEAVAEIVSARMAGELEELRGLINGIAPAPALPDIPAMVSEAVAALPAPQDGKSVTVDELRPLVEESVSKAVSDLPVAEDGKPGTDGVGLAGALIDRDGELIVTLTNGEAKKLGPIVGKDGEPGKPGTDGFGFDDLTLDHDGERTFTFKWAKGERIVEKSFSVPVPLYRGVYIDGKTYERGDTVTWAGSLWHCNEPSADKPEGGKGWTLAAKRGRDGKDAVLKAETKPIVRVA